MQDVFIFGGSKRGNHRARINHNQSQVSMLPQSYTIGGEYRLEKVGTVAL